MERRVIRAVARPIGDLTEVRTAIEDRYHNFRVVALLGKARIDRIRVDPVRYPYTLCPAAGNRVALIEGAVPSPRMSDYFRTVDARHQCTHQVDIAALGLALASRGIARRRYDIEAQEVREGRVEARLWCDGEPKMEVLAEHGVIVGPAAFAGPALGSGFTEWTMALDIEQAEQMLLLRRLMFIAMDSKHADTYELAFNAPPFGGCWVQQPERNADAIRLKNRVLPGELAFDHLTAGDDMFLAGG